MMMMAAGWPRLGGRRKKKAAAAERELSTALLVDGEEAVPKGYFAVYVGAEARRFVVPTSYLRQPAFRELMERAAEEFGFGQAGGLRIPCREEDFEATVAALDAATAAAAAHHRRRPGKRSAMAKARSL